MNRIKEVFRIVKEKFNILSKGKKIQLSISIVLTLVLMVSLPVLAWFMNAKKAASMVKINAPTVLAIGAGADDASEMINLANINVEEKVGVTRVLEGDYVFAIRGKYISAYDLQIARTTNIPFTYEIYRVSDVIKPENENKSDSELSDDEKSLKRGYGTTNFTVMESLENGTYISGTSYHVASYLSTDGDTYYYPYLTTGIVTGENVNPKSKSGTWNGTVQIGDGTKLISSDESFHKHNYDNYSSAKVNEYAEPLYWQASNILINSNGRAANGEFIDYYVLKIKWTTSFSNTKETDMIYITARRHN